MSTARIYGHIYISKKIRGNVIQYPRQICSWKIKQSKRLGHFNYAQNIKLGCVCFVRHCKVCILHFSWRQEMGTKEVGVGGNKTTKGSCLLCSLAWYFNQQHQMMGHNRLTCHKQERHPLKFTRRLQTFHATQS